MKAYQGSGLLSKTAPRASNEAVFFGHGSKPHKWIFIDEAAKLMEKHIGACETRDVPRRRPEEHVRKTFVDALAKRLGEHVADAIWLALVIVLPSLAWLFAPDTYSMVLSRRQITVGVLLCLLALAVAAWITRRLTQRRYGRRRAFAPIDELQRDVLRLLWAKDDGCWSFVKVQELLGLHPNVVRLACQRLQERGLIACNTDLPDPLTQLIHDGREYVVAHKLIDPPSILESRKCP